MEHQDTAGLDVSFAATLQQMSAESELQHSQVRGTAAERTAATCTAVATASTLDYGDDTVSLH